MKNIIITLLAIIAISIKCFAQKPYQYHVQGAEPAEKNYYFKVYRTPNFDVSEYQYALWKILKEHGYSMTDSINADIIVEVNYYSRQEDRLAYHVVQTGQQQQTILGKDVMMPVWGTSAQNFVATENVLDIKAYPKDADELSIPYWHFSMPDKMDWTTPLDVWFLYCFDQTWMNNGWWCIDLSKKNGQIKKVKVNGKKLKKQELIDFINRVNKITDKSDIGQYNKELKAQNN